MKFWLRTLLFQLLFPCESSCCFVLTGWMANKQTNKQLLKAVLLEKLIITWLLWKFPAFYRTRMFITVLTRACHWSISWARCIQSTPSHPISPRSLIIFFCHLRPGLSSGLFFTGFPAKILYTFLISPMRATCPACCHERSIIIYSLAGLLNLTASSKSTVLINSPRSQYRYTSTSWKMYET
jgi:hypothetical protein